MQAAPLRRCSTERLFASVVPSISELSKPPRIVRLYLLGAQRVGDTFDAAVDSTFNAKVISVTCSSTGLAFGLPSNQQMTRQRQFDLSELESLKGISISMTDDEQPLFMGVSYRRKTGSDKAFAWTFWTAVAIVYAACALVIWWVVT